MMSVLRQFGASRALHKVWRASLSGVCAASSLVLVLWFCVSGLLLRLGEPGAVCFGQAWLCAWIPAAVGTRVFFCTAFLRGAWPRCAGGAAGDGGSEVGPPRHDVFHGGHTLRTRLRTC